MSVYGMTMVLWLLVINVATFAYVAGVRRAGR